MVTEGLTYFIFVDFFFAFEGAGTNPSVSDENFLNCLLVFTVVVLCI